MNQCVLIWEITYSLRWKTVFVAKRNECRVCFSIMQPMTVPVRRILSSRSVPESASHTHYVLVVDCFVLMQAQQFFLHFFVFLFLRFVPMMQKRPIAMQVEPAIFVENLATAPVLPHLARAFCVFFFLSRCEHALKLLTYLEIIFAFATCALGNFFLVLFVSFPVGSFFSI